MVIFRIGNETKCLELGTDKAIAIARVGVTTVLLTFRAFDLAQEGTGLSQELIGSETLTEELEKRQVLSSGHFFY